jgi:transposase-like protein
MSPTSCGRADSSQPRSWTVRAVIDPVDRSPSERGELSPCMAFPAQRCTKLHSTNLLEWLNKEVKRRADVVGIFPNEADDAD